MYHLAIGCEPLGSEKPNTSLEPGKMIRWRESQSLHALLFEVDLDSNEGVKQELSKLIPSSSIYKTSVHDVIMKYQFDGSFRCDCE